MSVSRREEREDEKRNEEKEREKKRERDWREFGKKVTVRNVTNSYENR